MNLEAARRSAAQLRSLLSPYCHRIEIAGSIRRCKPDVGDIELVAIPNMVPDRSHLFDDAAEVSELDRYLESITKTGAVLTRDHLRPPHWGPKSKRLRWQEFAVDLFIVRPPAQWGVVFFLRTGSANFSHRAVTKRSQGGRCPESIQMTEGHLESHGQTVATSEEIDVFNALEMGWIEPQDRT